MRNAEQTMEMTERLDKQMSNPLKGEVGGICRQAELDSCRLCRQCGRTDDCTATHFISYIAWHVLLKYLCKIYKAYEKFNSFSRLALTHY